MNVTFEGKSENLSLEEALKDAMGKDSFGPGTDYYEYDIIETKCSFGGFIPTYTLYVKISRPE